MKKIKVILALAIAMSKKNTQLKNTIKTWIAIVFFFSLPSYLFGQKDFTQQKISVTYKTELLKNILNDLKNKYNISFSYNTEVESYTDRISLNVKNQTLDNFLKILCSKVELDYDYVAGGVALMKKVAKSKTTQTIRGQVLDATTLQPIIGGIVRLQDSSINLATATDDNGFFKLTNVPVGRQTILISSIGFSESIYPDLLIESSKEMIINATLKDKSLELGAVAVYATNRGNAINDMAVISANSISLEETKRFVASAFDPARVAQNFAGVTSDGDLNNQLVIRGNSPKGVLYRMEGIEILSPNHFTALGASGGSISMLSSSTLATSDFFTGAFPAEYGNATSGVMDLKLRIGNNEKREHSIMIGLLGIEAATEGYFSKKSKASYLINYRYSTLALMGKILKTSSLPDYQDLSYKINIPTKKIGNFSIWGIMGLSKTSSNPKKDTSDWKTTFDRTTLRNSSPRGSYGITHKIILNEKSYIQSIVSFSGEGVNETNFVDRYDSIGLVKAQTGEANIANYYIRWSEMYNLKIRPKSNLRTGMIFSNIGYNYIFKTANSEFAPLVNRYNSFGFTQQLQFYAQWQEQIGQKVWVNGGLHFTYLVLNKTYSIDPRMSLKYKLNKNNTFAVAVGLHSKPEDLSTLLYSQQTSQGNTQPNRNLKIPKNLHTIVGYTLDFKKDFQFKAELYHQYLFDIGVENTLGSSLSLANAANFLYVFNNNAAFVSKGTAMNYGIDLTLQKFFSKNYYFLFTSSFFNSTFKTKEQKTYSTVYNRNYTANIIGGKEFNIGKRKTNSIGLKAKFLVMGGNRFTPIDSIASAVAQSTIENTALTNSLQSPVYYRLDFGISFRFNTPKATHTIMLDIQNLTNRLNVLNQYYNVSRKSIEYDYQQGLFPLFNYRVEFSTK